MREERRRQITEITDLLWVGCEGTDRCDLWKDFIHCFLACGQMEKADCSALFD